MFEPVVDETEADQGENVDETNVDDESDPTLDQNENGENEEQNEANDGDVSNEAEINETEVETTPVVPTNEEVSTTETVPTEAPAEEGTSYQIKCNVYASWTLNSNKSYFLHTSLYRNRV